MDNPIPYEIREPSNKMTSAEPLRYDFGIDSVKSFEDVFRIYEWCIADYTPIDRETEKALKDFIANPERGKGFD